MPPSDLVGRAGLCGRPGGGDGLAGVSTAGWSKMKRAEASSTPVASGPLGARASSALGLAGFAERAMNGKVGRTPQPRLGRPQSRMRVTRLPPMGEHLDTQRLILAPSRGTVAAKPSGGGLGRAEHGRRRRGARELRGRMSLPPRSPVWCAPTRFGRAPERERPPMPGGSIRIASLTSSELPTREARAAVAVEIDGDGHMHGGPASPRDARRDTLDRSSRDQHLTLCGPGRPSPAPGKTSSPQSKRLQRTAAGLPPLDSVQALAEQAWATAARTSTRACDAPPLAFLFTHHAEARHTARVMTAVLAAYVLYATLDLPQGYWAVFTTLIVMQASIGGTVGASDGPDVRDGAGGGDRRGRCGAADADARSG